METDQDTRARDTLFHDSVLGVVWSGMARRKLLAPKTEAATRTGVHDGCESGHMTVTKPVSRHLGGELATFPWDPQGCRVVWTSTTVLH